MDKIDFTQVGGMPLDLNDLEFAFNGVHEAIKGFGKAFSGSGYVLQGCEVTDLGGFLYTIAPGWVVMTDGEPYYFPGIVSSSLPGGLSFYAFVPNLSNAPGESEVFESLDDINVYNLRRAGIALAAGAPVSAPITATLKTRLEEMLQYELAEPWRVVGDPGEPALLNGYNTGAGADAIAFRKEPNGVVRLRGLLGATAVGGTNLAAFTLPVGYRPQYMVKACMPKPTLTSPVSANFRSVYVSPTGDVVVFLSPGADALDLIDMGGFPTWTVQ